MTETNNVVAATATSLTYGINDLNITDRQWVEALPVLKEASNDMFLGQLIHSKDFHLESATHSLEIMNPKLDTRASGEHIYTAEQLFDKGVIPKDSNLNRGQIIKIIDRLIAFEISWIEGDPLPMTLFTCMYLHFPERLEDPYFKVYVNSLLATCDAINQIVSRGDVCCEEDFNLSAFGLTLLYPNNQHMVVNIRQLSELESDLDSKIIIENSKPIKDQDEIKILNSLRYRIIFRKLFYIIIFSISVSNLTLAIKSINEIIPFISVLKNDGYNNRDDIDVPVEVFNANLVSKLYSSVGAIPEEKPYSTAINSFEKLFTDFTTLFKMPHLLDSIIQLQQQAQQQQAQQQQNLDNVDSTTTTTTTTSPSTSPTTIKSEPIKISSILDYHFHLSKASPNIVVRSVLRRLLFPLPVGQFFKNDTMRESIIEWMNEFGIPLDKLLLDQEESGVPIFLETLSKVLQKLFVHMALNRARQRRKLKVSLFELSLLQNEADILDTNVAADPMNVQIYFGSFIFHLKLRVMQHFLFLGFELDIYANHELASVYFQLDYFYGIQSNVSNYIFKINHPDPTPIPTITNNTTTSPNKQINQSKNNNKNNNKKKGNQKQQKQQVQPTPPAPTPTVQPIQQIPTIEKILQTATHFASRAMFRILVILKQAGKIVEPICQYSQNELRHMKKFEPFFNPPYQQPDPLTFEHCNNSTKTDEPWISLLITTLEILKQSKSAVDLIIQQSANSNHSTIGPIQFYQLEEAKQLQRSILSMRLQISKLLPSYDLSRLPIEKVLAIPIPKFTLTIDSKPYFPNINIKIG